MTLAVTFTIANYLMMAKLPVVVLLGDSIRMGYAPYVTDLFDGEAWILSPEPNGGDSANVLNHLEEWVIRFNPAVVHFNAGLHDLRYDPETGTHQVELEAYRANLEKIVERLQTETDATLIFATTTPVLDDRHNAVKPFQRYEADVRLYNQIALGVMANSPNVKIHDLHTAAMRLGRATSLKNDGVHFTSEASRLLGRRVAAMIAQALEARDD